MKDLTSKRIAIYARYSSALQSEASIDDQVRRCKEYIAQQNGVIRDEDVFTDQAVSGASLQRDGFAALMTRVRSKQYDAVVVEDISRVTRDLADGTSLFKELRYLDVQLLCVADGIDSFESSGKVSFTLKNLFAEMYLDDLRYKTLRGQEGRALAGYSTGGLPYGYRSKPDLDDYGKSRGSIIEIDTEQAKVVERIFRMYLDGGSLSYIAQVLNEEQVPTARARTRHKQRGWVAGTVRFMLGNEAYIGRWTFKKCRWEKVPGTNCRRPKMRDEKDVLRQEFPERRIIQQSLWDAVQRRAAGVAAKYTGRRSSSEAPGVRNQYPLSGLLRCGTCGAPMVVSGGSHGSYYVCGDHKKRGTCSNRMSVREDIVRRRILETIRERLLRDEAIDYLRKKVAETLRALSKGSNEELRERGERLARTRERVQKLIDAIASGLDSPSVRNAIRDLEIQAEAEQVAIARLEGEASAPIKLPSREEISGYVMQLEQLLSREPVAAREALRRLLDGGSITLRPLPPPLGYYLASAQIMPFVGMLDVPPPSLHAPHPLGFQGSGTALGCAGRI